MKSNIHPLEWLALAAILLAANVSLLWGEVRTDWVYFPQGRAGWTLFTHPFVHVTGYHLLLDASAFALLYHSLADWSPLRRWSTVFICGTASLILTILMTPDLYRLGFCGLSGIGHGLMAVVGLKTLLNPEVEGLERRIMAGLTLGLLVKVIIEVATGDVFFKASHLGDVGHPITACHAGGFIGGCLAVMGLNTKGNTS